MTNKFVPGCEMGKIPAMRWRRLFREVIVPRGLTLHPLHKRILQVISSELPEESFDVKSMRQFFFFVIVPDEEQEKEVGKHIFYRSLVYDSPLSWDTHMAMMVVFQPKFFPSTRHIAKDLCTGIRGQSMKAFVQFGLPELKHLQATWYGRADNEFFENPAKALTRLMNQYMLLTNPSKDFYRMNKKHEKMAARVIRVILGGPDRRLKRRREGGIESR